MAHRVVRLTQYKLRVAGEPLGFQRVAVLRHRLRYRRGLRLPRQMLDVEQPRADRERDSARNDEKGERQYDEGPTQTRAPRPDRARRPAASFRCDAHCPATSEAFGDPRARLPRGSRRLR
jgi:hypothetical protein